MADKMSIWGADSKMILAIVLGSLAILLYLVVEFLSYKGFGNKALRFLQTLTLLLALLAHIIILAGPHSPRSFAAVIFGVMIIIAAGYLFYRSFWAELPRDSYSRRALNSSASVSQKGTYALIRHPGFWWYGMLLFGLYLLTGSQWLVVAAPIWWGLDFCLIVVEDFFLYPRIFSNYTAYKKKVPMIFPKLCSLKECLRTWNTA
jgi:protein-S-isoprenylcysteine O-methyltransferase Ste14